jgi:uncharacterized protein YyaL (SSP411 family)
MPNALSECHSLYLKQHADNPVNWHPWGDAAFAAAQAQNKPLLVSIGYSACHWCHVMAHECFEDNYIAGLMNTHFICVKVDREERPDVDQIYMEAVQMLGQSGGWPLNVFCLPDGRPFFGGTYFPPKDNGSGRVPWPQVLMRVADFYQRNHSELVENAHAIQANILAANQISDADAHWNPQLLIDAAKGICGNHDDRFGGFGKAPKFPHAMCLDFLFSLRNAKALDAQADFVRHIDSILHLNLRAMAHGGIFDQIGGGFARYSVDDYWLIPHFEKMLYDNALLLGAYTRGWLRFREPLFRAVVEETVGWLDREMRHPDGPYAAAIDADSEGVEGRYYVWTPDEIETVLGVAQGKRFCEVYNITASGTFEDGLSNPALAEGDFAVRESMTPLREKLLAARSQRIAPGKDEKILTAWNSWMIRSLAEAGFYFGRKDWLLKATQAAEWIWLNSSNQTLESLQLFTVNYPGKGPQITGYLHDYAAFGEACLILAGFSEWLESGSSKMWLQRAGACAGAIAKNFADQQGPGCYLTADSVTTPVARRKDWWDNATPSGNSSWLHLLVGLHALTGDQCYADALSQSLPAYNQYAQRAAMGIGHALYAAADHAIGVVVVKYAPGADVESLRSALATRPWRRLFIQPAGEVLPEKCFQLCVGSECHPATSDINSVCKKISG